MRRILMAFAVAALLVAGCGGDDDDTGVGDTPVSDSGGEDTAGEAGGEPTGADGAELPDPASSDPDAELADFPIPSPPGASDAVVTVVDGEDVASVTYPADRYDEVVDAYEQWFLDNGIIETPPDRSLGLVAMGGANDSGDYFVSITTDGDQILVQLQAS